MNDYPILVIGKYTTYLAVHAKWYLMEPQLYSCIDKYVLFCSCIDKHVLPELEEF